MIHSITLDDDVEERLLAKDTANYNRVQRNMNPDWVDLTATEYLQFLNRNWFKARYEEIINRRTGELAERYKVDPEFKARVDAFLDGNP